MSEVPPPLSNEATPVGRSAVWLPWVITGVALALLLVCVTAWVPPLYGERNRLARELAQVQGQLQATELSAEEERRKIKDLLSDRDTLTEQHVLAREQLDSALRDKADALAALEKARADLSRALGTQIAAGDVLIKERNGELVVDVSDQLLFETGKADVSEGGQKLLQEVAQSMRRLPSDQVFQVGGHTDSQRVVSKELVERFPSNWELSTTRATNVVRFLVDKGKVPGRQLVAAGFADNRPASSNKTGSGRQKNRRIEIVLLRSRRR